MKGPCSRTTQPCLLSLHSCSHLIVALLLLHSFVLFQAYGEEIILEYEESKKMCFYIKWSVNFSVDYETEKNEYKRVDFALPSDAEYAGSDCGDTYANVLDVKFGQDNYWNIMFTKSGDTYEGTISFTYNTNDTALFPDAKRKGPITVITSYPDQPVPLNTVFTCDGLNNIQTENVTQHIWEVTLQAFIPEGFLNKAKTHCRQDVPATFEQLETTTEAATSTISSKEPTTPMPVTSTLSMSSATIQPWRNTTNEVFYLKEVKITTVEATNTEECYTSQFRYLTPVTVGGVEAFLLFVLFICYIHRRKKKLAAYYEV